nr:cation-translocating P-type ATPase [uncultured Acetatifactor sp.]
MFEQCSVQDTVNKCSSDERKGLTSEEARRRLLKNGRNEMKAARKKTSLETFIEQLNDPLIYVLIAAAVVSLLLGEASDAAIIAVVICVNAFVGMVQEGKARKALESLKKLTSPRAQVIRDGRRQEIPAAELVTGDLVCLEAGCQVPADLRLIRTNSLKIEESSLTGESLPIEKDAGFTASQGKIIPLGDRHNMAYMSTIVTYGRGEGIVTAVGMDTELGQIAAMITETKEELTPLQKRLGELGKLLSVLSLILCAALFVIAVIQHRNILEMLITAISLAVAAVPEGLPAVVTICLALSVTRMVRVNTIVRKLPSVETLGAVSVVCSDKTGTLTQNRMTVEMCFVENRLFERREMGRIPAEDFWHGMTLCNDASIDGGSRIGDPTELALLDMAAEFGFYREALERQMPRVGELAFDSDRKMMTTCHKKGASLRCFTKGAPDEVLKKCTGIWLNGKKVNMTESHRRMILRGVEEMSMAALRTLAVAMKVSENRGGSAHKGGALSEDNLIFVGMVGMKDPPRPEAAQAVGIFREAGVDTVMITGDHVDTAYAIGNQLGIVNRPGQCMTGETLQQTDEDEFLSRLEDTRVFARVSPAQKVRIVKGFQKKGKIVAMTGDGVNDAPSLRAADIGIAMGMTGTDVAKQASDMILADDNFATIEKAIEEGRGVYENIRKSVIFLLSSNLGELMTMFCAVILGLASPLKSSHILWINLITDSLPALALGVDKNDGKSLMKNPPRKADESLFSRGGLACTCFYGALIACISLTAFLLLPIALLKTAGLTVNPQNLAYALGQDAVLAKSQTYAFTVLGMSQLFHAVGMRDTQRSVLFMKHRENKLMIAACIIGFLLQFAVTEVPFFINAFGTSHLTGREWLHLTLLAACPLLAHECVVLVGRLFQKKRD